MTSLCFVFRVFTIYLVVLLSIVCSQDVCVKKGPCKCEFSNGTGYDLTPVTSSIYLKTETYQLKNNGTRFAISTFYYHPCSDIILPLDTSQATTSTCKNSLALCWYLVNMDLNTTTNTYKNDGGNYQYLGSSNFTDFSADGKTVTYFNSPSLSEVTLVCTQTDDRLAVDSLVDTGKIKLTLYSRAGCLRQIEGPGRSLGSTLLIIFFSFVILYLVLGICTKKFLMGATGVEVIPNLAFWSDLPNLVKDGWAFMINGFKVPSRGAGPATSSDPNSYDSI